jgi:hypothetical protein
MVDGQPVPVLASEEVFERPDQAGFLDGLPELLGQSVRFDQGHDRRNAP